MTLTNAYQSNVLGGRRHGGLSDWRQGEIALLVVCGGATLFGRTL